VDDFMECELPTQNSPELCTDQLSEEDIEDQALETPPNETSACYVEVEDSILVSEMSSGISTPLFQANSGHDLNYQAYDQENLEIYPSDKDFSKKKNSGEVQDVSV
jgi:hypothetical protein